MDNVVRKFNKDPKAEMEVCEFISRKRTDLDYDMAEGLFSTIPENVVVIRIKDGLVHLETKVQKIGEKGSYNFADFLCMAKFKNNFDATLSYIKHFVYEQEIPFICVGTDYFKIITHVDRYNIPRKKLRIWKLSEIKPFYGKDAIFNIPRYDDFCLEPNNIDHQPIVGNLYNMHSEFSHEPDMYGGKFPWIEQLMRHVFSGADRDHYDLGMTYLQCLYLYPKQPLPILVLVSEDRSTGKSTFVDLLSVIFGENMVVANPEDIGSSFNSSYTDKNIIAIEESRFESVQTTEKLKNLATQKKILVNAKHQQPYSLPFFGKLIITSNDEKKFSKVDNKEIRYWVRKIPSLKEGQANHNILNDMIEEIPFLLKYLIDLPKPDFTRSRQVFTPEDIGTEALDTVKSESMSQLYKELYMAFEDIFNNNRDLEKIEFTPTDLKKRLYDRDSKVSAPYIKKTLETDFYISSGKNRRYDVLDDTPMPGSQKRIGRAYTLHRSMFDTLSLEGEYDKTIDEPF